MSILLALAGYEVRCVCYSDYLSKRDYQYFEEIFQDLDVKDKISYGTFNKIVEEFINE